MAQWVNYIIISKQGKPKLKATKKKWKLKSKAIPITGHEGL
jgi:hypothetical protein